MEKQKEVERQISFTLTNDQIQVLCNHFNVDSKEQQDFEICELLDKLIDSVVE